MVDDILLNQQKLTGNPRLILNEKQQQYYALAGNNNIMHNNVTFQFFEQFV